MRNSGACVVLTAMLAAPAHAAGDYLYWVGCSANPCNNAQIGLFAYRIDPVTGALALVPGAPYPPTWSGSLDSGTAEAVVDPLGRYLYVNRDLAGYAIHSQSGGLTPLPPPDALPPVLPLDLAPDPTGRFAFVAAPNPTGPPRVFGFRIAASGRLTQMPGSPFTTAGQNRVDDVVVDTTGRFLYASSWTGNFAQLAANAIDPATGALTVLPGSPYGPFGGPVKDLAVHPSGQFLHMAGDAGLHTFRINTDGTLTVLSLTIGVGGDDVVVDPTGRFLYTGTFGALAGATVDQTTGAVSPLPPGSTFSGDFRRLAIESGGRFLYALGGSATLGFGIHGFAIDQANGVLTPAPWSPLTTPLYGTITIGQPAAPSLTKGDFNLDGRTDILWRHSVSGQNVSWFMNGATLIGGTFTTPPSLADTNWRIAGTPDFNGDRKTDILWHNVASGALMAHFMNGMTLVSSTPLSPPAVTDTAWRAVGTADFNGDGKPDVLWRHQTSGQTALWFMDGVSLVGGTLWTTQAPGWDVSGIGEVNFHGGPDVVWRHSATGELQVWYTLNTAVSPAPTDPPALADAAWRLVAVADYNLDGRSDFLWRHAGSGQNVLWFMNGPVLASGTFLDPPALADVGWQIVGPR